MRISLMRTGIMVFMSHGFHKERFTPKYND